MKRCSRNPIITRCDIPTVEPHLKDVTSVFNPGAVRYGEEYLLLLRVQNRGRETFLMPAFSDDGVTFTVERRTATLIDTSAVGETVHHVYDPRITLLDGAYYIVAALDLDNDTVLGLSKTIDFQRFDFLGVISDLGVRNGVLFPEKVRGKYLMLERPNEVEMPGGGASGSAICLAESDDLRRWKRVATVMEGRPHYWDELIGSGPPPVKTRRGWLHVYHGVARHFQSVNIYQVGAVLLDLQDPTQVLARSRYNVLEPREMYELVGQVPNIVFPSGMIVREVDPDGFSALDSEVLVYYGAADTVVGLASTTVGELIAACYEGGNDG